MDYPGSTEIITFTCTGGAPGGTITVKVRDPLLVTTTYTYGTSPQLTNPSAGVFVLTIPCPIAGTWAARFVATGGTNAGAFEVTWVIANSTFF